MERKVGLDIFRIMCCLGVVTYHVVDDTFVFSGGRTLNVASVIYYMASLCIPGFFILAGYLIGSKNEVTLIYCENKAFGLMKKYAGWIVFFSLLQYVLTYEIINWAEQYVQGLFARGILPIAWFALTYFICYIVAYPLYKFIEHNTKLFGLILIIGLIIMFSGCLHNYTSEFAQSFWLDWYLVYFMLGIFIGHTDKTNKRLGGIFANGGGQLTWIVANIIGFIIYFYKIFKVDNVKYAPHTYYDKWYYFIWIVTIFIIVKEINLNRTQIIRFIECLSRGTLTVWFMHLPAVLYISERVDIVNAKRAVIIIFFVFAVCEVLAIAFRRLPILNKLV